MKPLTEESEYLNLEQLAACQSFPFTIGQLRRFWRDDKDGIRQLGRRFGKSIVIKRSDFQNWLDGKQKKG
jgi:hypothetical protein